MPLAPRHLRYQRRAFTLVELLIVIVIIAVLTALSVPLFGKFRREANRASTSGQLRQIGTAIHLYTQDNNGTYPKPDDLPTGGFWATAIAGRPTSETDPNTPPTEYLGKGTQWIHQELVAPGVRYAKPSGGFHKPTNIRLTYCATGVMCAIEGGFLNVRKGRKLSLIPDPARSPLIFLARQRPAKDGYSRTVVFDPNHAEVTGDIAKTKPEDTVLFNFDLGSMPVLMADGHIKTVVFSELKSFVKRQTWQARPQ